MGLTGHISNYTTTIELYNFMNSRILINSSAVGLLGWVGALINAVCVTFHSLISLVLNSCAPDLWCPTMRKCPRIKQTGFNEDRVMTVKIL